MRKSIVAIALFLMLEACGSSHGDFILSNGQRVSCEYKSKEDCGLTLTGCKDGQKYHCQTNVTELNKEK